MKKLLCEAFCNSLRVRKVPLGWAVSTAYYNIDGDPILFYILPSETNPKTYRLEDDGTQITLLAAQGVNIKKGTRRDALDSLLNEYSLTWDHESQIVYSEYADEKNIAKRAMEFIAFLLRLQDLVLLDTQTVINTFRQDALAAVHKYFDPRAIVSENESMSPGLSLYSADVVIMSQNQNGPSPLALYLGTTEEKGLQALVFKMESEKYRGLDSKVVLLVEHSKKNPLRDQTYALAQARLDGVLSFRGVEEDSMSRLNNIWNISDKMRH